MLFKHKKPVAQPEVRILIVEDDLTTRDLMQVLLNEYGQCSFATNGTEAIEKVSKALDENKPFNLICLDIIMPEMDGLEALKKIREAEEAHGIQAENSVKVIMITTASQQAKTMRAFHYGCNGFLVKPISKEAILKEMKKLPLRRSINPWRNNC